MALLIGGISTAKAQELPAPSPHAEVEQRVGLTDFDLEYSRPSQRGREIWGDLVPYGKVWRAGANQATKIEFNTEVNFLGIDGPITLQPGEYALFITPNETNATVHFNTAIDSWGSNDYKAENDVAVVDVEVMDAEQAFETMVFYFDNVQSGNAELILSWSTKKIIIPFQVEFIEQSLKNIDAAIKEDPNSGRVYNAAAGFYIDNQLDPAKALEYAQKSVELDKKFYTVQKLSAAYAMNGDYKSAIATAKESMKLAKEANYDPYIKINKDNIEKWSKM